MVNLVNSESLFKLPQFKQQFFPNTYKNKLKIEKNFIIKDKLIDLLKAYANIHKRNQQYTLKFSSSKLFTIKDGQNIISKEILSNPNWFIAYIAHDLDDGIRSEILNINDLSDQKYLFKFIDFDKKNIYIEMISYLS